MLCIHKLSLNLVILMQSRDTRSYSSSEVCLTWVYRNVWVCEWAQ